MGDGLQLHFVLLLCLDFCHGRNFLVQEALETGAKGGFFAPVLISYDKKNIYSVPLSRGNLFLGMRSVEVNIAGSIC